MKKTDDNKKEYLLNKNYEIIICGSGPAGIPAQLKTEYKLFDIGWNSSIQIKLKVDMRARWLKFSTFPLQD